MTAFEATWDVYELYVLHKAYAGWLPGHLQLLRPWLCSLLAHVLQGAVVHAKRGAQPVCTCSLKLSTTCPHMFYDAGCC